MLPVASILNSVVQPGRQDIERGAWRRKVNRHRFDPGSLTQVILSIHIQLILPHALFVVVGGIISLLVLARLALRSEGFLRKKKKLVSSPGRQLLERNSIWRDYKFRS